MTDNAVAALEQRRSGSPTRVQARFENLIRSRSMVPNGNCRHATESSRVVNQNESVAPRHNNVMSELILNDDLRDN